MLGSHQLTGGRCASSLFVLCAGWGRRQSPSLSPSMASFGSAVGGGGEIRTPVDYLVKLLETEDFKANTIDTAWLDRASSQGWRGSPRHLPPPPNNNPRPLGFCAPIREENPPVWRCLGSKTRDPPPSKMGSRKPLPSPPPKNRPPLKKGVPPPNPDLHSLKVSIWRPNKVPLFFNGNA